MSVRNKPKKKAAKKAAKKVPVKEAAKAFENIFTPIEKKGAPEPQQEVENWDEESFNPNAPIDESIVRVVKVGGETISLEESDSLEYPEADSTGPTAEWEDVTVDIKEDSKTPLKEEDAPVRDIVTETAQTPPESPMEEQEMAILKKEDYAKVVEALIDALNYLYPLAKIKTKPEDFKKLTNRVARGRQLVKQLQDK